MVIKVGPAPDENGNGNEIAWYGNENENENGIAWDESECGDLVQIFISHDTSKIYSLQFQYVVDYGTLMLSQLHGESIGLKFETVQLNYPSEFITCVDGHLSYKRITSLTFRTNKGTYGPFGTRESDEREFKFHTGQDNQFGGFHGMAFDSSTGDTGIKSIGVYIKPLTAIPSLQRPNIKVEPTIK